MGLTLGTNIGALRAQRQLDKITTATSEVYQRLSSGMRINSAGDDPAGLQVAESLRSDAKLASVAIRNANDGLSLTAVADGALEEVGGILQRMAELSQQSSNGIFTNTQRSAMQLEFETLGSEIQRISVVTTFNDVNLLSNSSNVTLQVGFRASSTSQITLTGISGTLASLGLANTGSSALRFSLNANSTENSQSASRLALDAVSAAIGSLSSTRGQLGAVESRLSIAINYLSSTRENLLAAESNVRDADIAAEVTEMTRLQVLQQAATSILAQANQSSQIVLGLLAA